MIDFSNNPASIQKTIPKEKLFDSETIEKFQLSDVVWRMSIKPGIRNVVKYIDEQNRLEEIEVLTLHINTLPDKATYLSFLRKIHSQIMYPCVVFFEYGNKFKIAAWKTVDSKSIYNHQVLKSAYVSAWIHEPPASEKTKKCVEGVYDLLMNGEGDIKALYSKICQEILYCPPQFIGSRKHLTTILYDLCGKDSKEILEKIDGTRRYDVKNSYAKYQEKEYMSSFKYIYEYEDIWYTLMNDEKLRGIVEKRRYSSIEELVYRIDSKYEEGF